jgi:hypothetical protein
LPPLQPLDSLRRAAAEIERQYSHPVQ